MSAWPALDLRHTDEPISDLIHAFLLDFGIAAIDDTAPGVSRVFFNDASDRDRAADALRQQFGAIQVDAVDVPDENWAARSQASLTAVRVGGIVVAPPWDVPDTARLRPPGARGHSPGQLMPDAAYEGVALDPPIVIIVRPSMGFGTGHHATTRLCLAALQRIDLRGRRVVDVGTGSGVLAIAASLLGAAAVVGIDDDADAIAAASDNVSLNPDARVTIELLDLRRTTSSPWIPADFDLVVANLTGGLLTLAAAHLTSLAGPSGRLVLSGLMDSEEDDVRRAFPAWDVEWRDQEDEWVCLELAPHRK